MLIAAGFACKPGAEQSPIQSTITVWNSLFNTGPAPVTSSNNNLTVKARIITSVKTTDDDDNVVAYPYPNGNSYIDNVPNASRFTSDQDISIDVVQPEGATAFVSSSRAQTKECGWPIPGQAYNAEKGGDIEMEALGQILNYPAHETFYAGNFSTV